MKFERDWRDVIYKVGKVGKVERRGSNNISDTASMIVYVYYVIMYPRALIPIP